MLIGLCLAGTAAKPQIVKLPSSQTSVRWRDVSIDEYRQHLVRLSSLLESCAKQRNLNGCDPAAVGPDDRVPIALGTKTELRLIRYGWLRVLFSKAEDPDPPAGQPATQKSPSSGAAGKDEVETPTSQLLKDAKARLESDLAQSYSPEPPIPQYAEERAAMRDVLAGPDFRKLQQTSVRDSVLEKLQKWLNRLFQSVARLKTHSAWLGRVLVWGFVLVVSVVLIFSLIRLERRWRFRLKVEENDRPAPGAASARDWQLWLEDARRAAASGLWREAIHFVYWAAISRLESRRLWPADRARTPREYLALVAPEDPRRPGLSQLTNTFERFWYGGRAAGERDFRNAETIAASLISGGSPASAAEPEGGVR